MRVLVVIPVFNEELQLAGSVEKLHRQLDRHCLFDYEIVIADNGSTDATLQLANSLAQQYSHLRVSHEPLKGRGRALKHVWCEIPADIVSYLDVDLSTDLAALPALLDAVTVGGFDLASGSRLLPRSRTKRGWKREVISRCYMLLVKAVFHVAFSDAQCGFKAITKRAADRLLPAVKDPAWFFDTELLVLAEQCGFRIFELPVTWIEDPDSRVRLISTACADIKGLLRLWWNIRCGVYNHLIVGCSQKRDVGRAIP